MKVGYKGDDGFGICISKDNVGNQEQSSLLVELMNRYLHLLEHRLSALPYACSDHASCNKKCFYATIGTEYLISPGWHKNFDKIENIVAFLGLGVYYLAENSKDISDNNGSIPFVGRFENGPSRESIEEMEDNEPHFTIEIPINVSHITIWTESYIGEVELFVRSSNTLKIDKLDFRNFNFGSNEQFKINTNGARVYYIMVEGIGYLLVVLHQ